MKAVRLGAAAEFPYSPDLVKEWTKANRFGDPFKLYRIVGGRVHLPRSVASGWDEDRREDGVGIKCENLFSPREDQDRLVSESLALLRSGESHVIQAATGYGKSFCGAAIAASLGRKTLVLMHKQDLMKQWVAAFSAIMGSEVGIGLWQGNKVPLKSDGVVVGLVQSVGKGPSRYEEWMFHDYGLVMFDEVHRISAHTFNDCIWHLPCRLRLGLSATPKRSDGQEAVFRLHIGPTKVFGGVETLIPKVIVRRTPWAVPSNIPHSMGRLGGVVKAMSGSPERNSMIVDFLMAAMRKGRRIIAFTESLAHIDRLEALCAERGVPKTDIGVYVGLDNYRGSPKEKEMARTLSKGKPVILATYKAASEGTDIPELDAAVLCTPRADVEQIVGRIRRNLPGKRMPVVFDLVDNGSAIINAYARKRLSWYKSIGSVIV